MKIIDTGTINETILGSGDDIFRGTLQNDRIDAAEGNDTIDSLAGDDKLIGGIGDDFLLGGEGNDFLDGSSGNDRLEGGAGNDTYIVDNHDEVIEDNAAGASDTVFSGSDWTLGANIENLVLLGEAVFGIGNADHNWILGSDAANYLIGGDGNDTILGDGDNELFPREDGGSRPDSSPDTILGGDGNDYLFGGLGDDSLIGGQGRNSLFGGVGYDTIVAGDDGDYIVGGLRGDRIFTGAGADTIAYDTIDDLTGADNIYNFNADEDFLDISGVLRALGVTAPNDFHYFIENAQNASDPRPEGSYAVYIVIDDGNPFDNLDEIYFVAELFDVSGVFSANNIIITQLNGGDDVLRGDDDANDLYGYAGNDTLYGYANEDYLDGGIGQDLLFGGFDNDRLFGGTGNDTLYGDNGEDFLNGYQGDDLIFAGSGNDEIYASDGGRDTLFGGDGDDNFQQSDNLGNEGDSFFYGESGNDWIFAATGNDFIDGGSDRDYVFGAGGDDTIYGDSPFDGGIQGSDSLDGGEGNDRLLGFGGNDSLNGGRGNDILVGDNGNDTLIGDAGDDFLSGGVGLFGNDGSDLLIGGAGSDTFVGASGVSTLEFGQNDDGSTDWFLFPIDAIDFYPTIRPGVAVIRGFDATNEDRVNLIDVFRYSGAVDPRQGHFFDILNGNELWIDANRDGRITRTADLMIAVFENFQGTLDASDISVVEGQVFIADENAASLRIGTDLADFFYGGGQSDTFVGAGGNDIFIGGGGVNSLVGGSGDDIYRISSALDQIFEQVFEGFDIIESMVDYTIAGNVEALYLFGTASRAVGANGDEYLLANETRASTLVGNSGNDTLAGYGGAADWFDGGEGNDVYYADQNDVIVDSGGIDTLIIDPSIARNVSWTLASSLENLELNIFQEGAAGHGNASDNYITQRALGWSVSLFGYEGNDTLDGASNGGTGDYLDGGLGNDTYHVRLGDRIIEQVNGGHDIAYAYDDLLLGSLNEIEQIIVASANVRSIGGDNSANDIFGDLLAVPVDVEFFLTIDGAGGNDMLRGSQGGDSLYGGSDDDTIYGFSGADILNGGSGRDLLVGNDGDDVYIVDTQDDQVIEAENEGFDRILFAYAGLIGLTVNLNLSSLPNGVILYNNIESYGLADILGQASIIGLDSADALTGNAWANGMDGGLGDDTMYAGASNDTAMGGGGADLIYGELGNDYLNGQGDTDLLYGNGGQDTLMGEGGNDSAVGGGGNDWLDGGIGQDDLRGNNNNDTLLGGDDSDLLTGGFANDLLVGDAMADTLSSVGGDDTLLAGSGNDTVYGGGGSDSITGGAGNDWLHGGAGNDWFFNTAGGQRLSGVDTLIGGAGDDTLNLQPLSWGRQVVSFDDIVTVVSGQNVIQGVDQVNNFQGDLIDSSGQVINVGGVRVNGPAQNLADQLDLRGLFTQLGYDPNDAAAAANRQAALDIRPTATTGLFEIWVDADATATVDFQLIARVLVTSGTIDLTENIILV